MPYSSRPFARLLAACAVSAGILGLAAPAHAQNFFERLFGLTPSRPSAPPAYNAPPPGPQPGAFPPDGSDEPVKRAPPAPARPVAIKAPSEDLVLGRDLKLNGTAGILRLDRSARGDMRAKLTLAGRRSADSVDTCSVQLGGADGVALVAQGRPEGAPRYQLQDATCPLQLDVLDEAVLVKGPAEACPFETAQCLADPTGVWGPEPSMLIGRAKEFEALRGSADKAARDNYKVLTQRAKPEGVRAVVSEQAAFSADREQICRNYAREGTHSFCNAKYSEARALSLATRLGVSSTTASVQPSDSRPALRRNRDPYALPSSDELMQRLPPADDTE